MESAVTEPGDWRDDAACRDADPELFFPIGTTGPALRQVQEAGLPRSSGAPSGVLLLSQQQPAFAKALERTAGSPVTSPPRTARECGWRHSRRSNSPTCPGQPG